ncbi:MAG: glycoside hydrolase family 16 protein [Fimbriimonadaceae bacterium]|nr:glycoside hydrolase family 16 protein [Fimbriimonadaceae bacterium]
MFAIATVMVLALPPYKLVWSDEFDKDGKPNPAHWIYETGFVRNKEPQLYREENVSVKDGVLVIEGRRERVPNPSYDPSALESDWRRARKHAELTSGSIKTATKQLWTYGRFECRGKFDVELGLWPAFWMTGPSREWPANGEIDIMEYYQRTYLANLAWGGQSRGVGPVEVGENTDLRDRRGSKVFLARDVGSRLSRVPHGLGRGRDPSLSGSAAPQRDPPQGHRERLAGWCQPVP